MRYYKRHWDENRGDQYADWGTATYYFEVDGTQPVRQLEVYKNSKRLKYTTDKSEDEFGGLAQEFDEKDFAQFEIQKEEFENVWAE